MPLQIPSQACLLVDLELIELITILWPCGALVVDVLYLPFPGFVWDRYLCVVLASNLPSSCLSISNVEVIDQPPWPQYYLPPSFFFFFLFLSENFFFSPSNTRFLNFGTRILGIVVCCWGCVLHNVGCLVSLDIDKCLFPLVLMENLWLFQQAFYRLFSVSLFLFTDMQASQEQEFSPPFSTDTGLDKYHQWRGSQLLPSLVPWLLFCCRHTGLSASLRLELILSLQVFFLQITFLITDQPCLQVSVSLLLRSLFKCHRVFPACSILRHPPGLQLMFLYLTFWLHLPSERSHFFFLKIFILLSLIKNV